MDSVEIFAGVGGFSHALKGLFETQVFCEVDTFCQQVLANKMETGLLPRTLIHGDVQTLSLSNREGLRAILCSSPCQGFSPRGLNKGLDDARSGLIKEVIRLADKARPDVIFMENVPLILKAGMTYLLEELVQKRDYTLRWACVPASAVGAHHFRRRWFCLAIKEGAEWPGPTSNTNPTTGPRPRALPATCPGRSRWCLPRREGWRSWVTLWFRTAHALRFSSC
jgi:DNA (cytosine-5)-methyltransferase 1